MDVEEQFRDAILTAADVESMLAMGDTDIKIEVPSDAQIQLASNGTGAWVGATIWVNRATVGATWAGEVANPPSIDDLAEALKGVLREASPAVPMTLLKPAMEVLARHQGKDKWMNAKL